MLQLHGCALLSHLSLCDAKILQESPYPEQTLLSVGPNRVKVGCDELSYHKCEFDDMFDHTPTDRKFLCFRSQNTPFNIPEGLKEVSNYQ